MADWQLALALHRDFGSQLDSGVAVANSGVAVASSDIQDLLARKKEGKRKKV